MDNRVGRILRSAALLLLVCVVTGCGTVNNQGGSEFNLDALESTLKIGASTQAQVRSALGPPYGEGGGMLPWHDAPRTVWTYYYENGQIDLGGPNTQLRRSYLFVFFQGDQFDSYMWFATTGISAKPR